MPLGTPIIPETIKVHLGNPESASATVTVPFVDYVANVASSEIYPTWPEEAIRANMLAQISFALNRVYTEYYRTRGYPFDITNSTAYDQYYVRGRDVFENVQNIAREQFNSYIRRKGSVEPLFAQYCDGIRVQCNGLSQWGTVELAKRGYTAEEILKYYYGDDIEIIENVPVGEVGSTAPPIPLRLGSVGDAVRQVQIRLNRISKNYPSIPKIVLTDGIFGTDTEAAVRNFQRIFNLPTTGAVNSTMWYAIQNVYIGVKRLNDLNSEGISLSEITQQYPSLLRLGSTGDGVKNLQYFLSYLSDFYDTIPNLAVDGIFGPQTLAAVRAAQEEFDLTVDGLVGPYTWDAIYNAYIGIVGTVPPEYTEGVTVPYGGVPLRIGADSQSVRLLQEYLNAIGTVYTEIPPIEVTGYFGSRTQSAVIAYQKLFGITPSGVVSAVTWNSIIGLYEALYQGEQIQAGQYPGYEIGT